MIRRPAATCTRRLLLGLLAVLVLSCATVFLFLGRHGDEVAPVHLHAVTLGYAAGAGGGTAVNRGAYESALDPNSGRTYWYNRATGHPVWTKPVAESAHARTEGPAAVPKAVISRDAAPTPAPFEGHLRPMYEVLVTTRLGSPPSADVGLRADPVASSRAHEAHEARKARETAATSPLQPSPISAPDATTVPPPPPLQPLRARRVRTNEGVTSDEKGSRWSPSSPSSLTSPLRPPPVGSALPLASDGIVLTCNGVPTSLASFTESAPPPWLNATATRRNCDTLAACLWFHCRSKCVDGPARPSSTQGGGGLSRSRRLLGSRPRAGGGGSSGGVRDGLQADFDAFDASGSVAVTAPAGGSMVTPTKASRGGEGNGFGTDVGPLKLAQPLKRGERPVMAPVDVIVTLTSLPTRLAHTLDTITSLRQQTLPPKVIVVAVPVASGRAGEASKEYAIPRFLVTTPGVCVLRTPRDWGPATKLVGLARELFLQGVFTGNEAVRHSKSKGLNHTASGLGVGEVLGEVSSGTALLEGESSSSSSSPPPPLPHDSLSSRSLSSHSLSSRSPSSHSLSRLRLVVCDDDTWYPPRTVEALVRWSLRLPRAAIGQHGWVAHPDLVYAGPNKEPLHYWGRHLSSPRPVSVLTGNTAYLVQPRHLDSLFWEGLEDTANSNGPAGSGKGSGEGSGKDSGNGSGKGMVAAWEAASTGAKYMDDVWLSGHLSRRQVMRLAVPMDKEEPRARWSGGDGPTLERVEGMGRRHMNDVALRTFEGIWDVLRCSPAQALSSSASAFDASASSVFEAQAPAPVSCAGPVALLLAIGPGGDAADLTSKCQDDDNSDGVVD